MDRYPSMFDGGAILDAARHGFEQYKWLMIPEFDQEGEVQAAERVLAVALDPHR
jgi:hypothetical protein